MLYNLHFFSSKCRLFHNATLFGFCITHILNTGCAKIWKKKIRHQKVKVATARGSQASEKCKQLTCLPRGGVPNGVAWYALRRVAFRPLLLPKIVSILHPLKKYPLIQKQS